MPSSYPHFSASPIFPVAEYLTNEQMNADLRDSFSQHLEEKKAKVKSEWKNYIKNKAQRHWSIDKQSKRKKKRVLENRAQTEE